MGSWFRHIHLLIVVAIFADYVSLYHDGENYSFVDNAGLAHDLESNTDIQSINIGVTYQF